MAKCKGEPEFSIQFTVSDPESAKNELLGKAIEDSKEKASVLSRSAGVELGDIQLIDYSWGELDIYTRPMDEVKCLSKIELDADCDDIGFDIEADDIDITDTVTVVWALK